MDIKERIQANLRLDDFQDKFAMQFINNVRAILDKPIPIRFVAKQIVVLGNHYENYDTELQANRKTL